MKKIFLILVALLLGSAQIPAFTVTCLKTGHQASSLAQLQKDCNLMVATSCPHCKIPSAKSCYVAKVSKAQDQDHRAPASWPLPDAILVLHIALPEAVWSLEIRGKRLPLAPIAVLTRVCESVHGRAPPFCA